MTPAIEPNNGVTLHSQSQGNERLTYGQMLEEARALFVGKRHAIDIAQDLKGRDKKDETWFKRANAVLRALEEIGTELRFISDHAEAYDAWKASLGVGQ